MPRARARARAEASCSRPTTPALTYNPPSLGLPYPSIGPQTKATFACASPRGRSCPPGRCAAANLRRALVLPGIQTHSPRLCPRPNSYPQPNSYLHSNHHPHPHRTRHRHSVFAPSPLTPSLLPSAPPPLPPHHPNPPATLAPPSPFHHPPTSPTQPPGQASAKRRKVFDQQMHTALYEDSG
jgi:hypothetical protein